MSDHLKLLRHITKDFDDVKNLIAEHKAIAKQLRTVDRKLKTAEAKYKFLTDIISVGGQDTVVEKSAKLLFKSAGFKEVRHLVNVRPKREDLQIWCDDCLILAECKGTKYSVPPDAELNQIKKYIDHRANIIKSKLPVFGLTIINHDNSKLYHNRNRNPIDKNKHEYAVASQYGIITTVDLVRGFLFLKNNNITFDTFKQTIKQFGVIKFGDRAD
jgi:hypothetical protein